MKFRRLDLDEPRVLRYHLKNKMHTMPVIISKQTMDRNDTWSFLGKSSLSI